MKNDKNISIESSTRNQTNDPQWFKYHKNRFTASLCKRVGNNTPKNMVMRSRSLIKSCNSNYYMGMITNKSQKT